MYGVDCVCLTDSWKYTSIYNTVYMCMIPGRINQFTL